MRVRDQLIPPEVMVEMPSAPDLPSLTMKIEMRKEVPVCTEITIRAKEDGREVRTTDLRAVQLQDLLELIVTAVSSKIISAGPEGLVLGDNQGATTENFDAALATIRAARKGTRARITDDFLREVAETYRANVDGSPTKAVEEKYGVEYRTAARWVERARAKGYLPATTPGKRKA
ncbi:hypothetical protein BS329_39940 [Amycolatopsis coloradensis]|uniref:Uncharacterized protein n=1 Tax=Amycolatopsis coloradensis TaxID=76021 RepID=A0A1R0KE16_9PSEU|nr:hypothetical protein [Amycolatopsis coloradensis]OLZ43262.1 hypothetical protein BS329_39940 [Amycolatopsis coloradensis]